MVSFIRLTAETSHSTFGHRLFSRSLKNSSGNVTYRVCGLAPKRFAALRWSFQLFPCKKVTGDDLWSCGREKELKFIWNVPFVACSHRNVTGIFLQWARLEAIPFLCLNFIKGCTCFFRGCSQKNEVSKPVLEQFLDPWQMKLFWCLTGSLHVA